MVDIQYEITEEQLEKLSKQISQIEFALEDLRAMVRNLRDKQILPEE
jgi:hypothetical protein